MNITKGNINQLKQAITFYGPVSILINTQPKSFKFYGSGTYYDQSCSKFSVVSVLWTRVLQDFFHEVFLGQTSHPLWKDHSFKSF